MYCGMKRIFARFTPHGRYPTDYNSQKAEVGWPALFASGKPQPSSGTPVSGVKAVSREATERRADPSLFASMSVSELRRLDDYTLENHGRLVHTMRLKMSWLQPAA